MACQSQNSLRSKFYSSKTLNLYANPAEARVDITLKHTRQRGRSSTAKKRDCEQYFLFTGVTILVDPWLVGELVFYGQEWAFRGKKGVLTPDKVDVDAIAKRADLILLTQVIPPAFI